MLPPSMSFDLPLSCLVSKALSPRTPRSPLCECHSFLLFPSTNWTTNPPLASPYGFTDSFSVCRYTSNLSAVVTLELPSFLFCLKPKEPRTLPEKLTRLWLRGFNSVVMVSLGIRAGMMRLFGNARDWFDYKNDTDSGLRLYLFVI